MRNKLFVAILLFTLVSCSRKHSIDKLTPIKTSPNINVTLEGRYWRSLYAPTNAFELIFTNNSRKHLPNCRILINDQYKHTLNGLQGKKNKINEFVVFESGNLQSGTSVTIPFTKESGNLSLFQIKDNIFFIPKTITLISDTDTAIWNFDLKLQESYF